jgi:hypothetical protein
VDELRREQERLQREITENIHKLDFASLQLLDDSTRKKAAVDVALIRKPAEPSDAAAKYDLVRIMRDRWAKHQQNAPMPTPEAELQPYQADLAAILGTKFHLHDLVQYRGSGDPSDPASYDFAPGMRGRLLDFYRAYGFLHITGVLTPDECREAIFEIIREVIARQGFKPEYQITVPAPAHPAGGFKLNALTAEGLANLERYKDDVLRFFTKAKDPATGRPAYTPTERRMLAGGWTMHRDFGACTDPSNLHMKFQWKIRQDARLLKLWQVAVVRVFLMWLGDLFGIHTCLAMYVFLPCNLFCGFTDTRTLTGALRHRGRPVRHRPRDREATGTGQGRVLPLGPARGGHCEWPLQQPGVGREQAVTHRFRQPLCVCPGHQHARVLHVVCRDLRQNVRGQRSQVCHRQEQGPVPAVAVYAAL